MRLFSSGCIRSLMRVPQKSFIISVFKGPKRALQALITVLGWASNRVTTMVSIKGFMKSCCKHFAVEG